MEDAGMQLLRRIEAMVAEVQEEQKRYRNVTEELTALKSKEAANLAKTAERVQRCRDKKRDSNVTSASIKASRSLEKKKKELKSLPGNVTVALPDHPSLIAHFSAAVQRVAGVKYEFAAEDGKHAKTLLQRYGLDEACRVIDLAAVRFQREDFYRKLGLTLRQVANDANKLRTANGQPQANGHNTPIWKKQGFESPEAYAKHLDSITLDPPLAAGAKG